MQRTGHSTTSGVRSYKRIREKLKAITSDVSNGSTRIQQAQDKESKSTGMLAGDKHMVLPKCNIVLAHMHAITCNLKTRLKVGVAPFSIASLHPSNQRMKTRDQNRCHAPFCDFFNHM